MTIKRSRRRWLAIPVAVVAMSIAVAGCGSSGGSSSGGTGSSAATSASAGSSVGASDATASPAAAEGASLLPAAEGTTTYPLTLTSPWGTTVLTERPERVATVGYINDLDNTLALGVTPVWADSSAANYSWTKAAGSDKVGTLGELGDAFPFEDIAASKPDLIVAIQTEPGQLEESYQRLSSIAPVLVAPKPGFDVGWEETVRLIGSTLDLTKHADDVVADVDAKVAAVAAANPAFAGKSLSFLLWHGGQEALTFRSFEGSPTASLFADLGFTPSPAAATFNRDNLIISAENYGQVDADVLLIASPKEQLDALLAVPTFAAVPAVAAGRYAVIDLDEHPDAGWAASWPSALSVPYLVETITPPLAKAVS